MPIARPAAGTRDEEKFVRVPERLRSIVDSSRSGSRRWRAGGPTRSSRRRSHTLLLVLGLLVVGALLGASSALAKEVHVFAPPPLGEAGSGAGQLSLAAHSGVAVDDETGAVYVADTANHRVSEFSSAGAFVRAWGWGVTDGSAEAQTCTATCQEGLAGSGPGQFEAPTFIAVDNDPASLSHGDVYVGDTTDNLISKFGPGGALISSWAGGGQLGGFAGIAGIATDTSGDLWAYDESSQMREFDQAGGLLTEWNSGIVATAAGIAVDSADDLYVVRGSEAIAKFDPTGAALSEEIDPGAAHGLAVDPSTGDLYADDLGAGSGTFEVVRRDASGVLIETFGAGTIGAGAGIAVDGSTHGTYVADAATSQIELFPFVVLPAAITRPAEAVTEDSATLTGEVNPEGIALTECSFEAVEAAAYEPGAADPYAAGQTVPCEQPAASIPVGSGLQPVSAPLTGLAATTTYHFRLRAENSSGVPVFGQDRTFATGAEPIIDSSFASGVEASAATLNAQVNPVNSPTTVHFEYLDQSDFQNGGYANPATRSTAESASIGSDDLNHLALANLAGLAPATIYHFRAVAHNLFGTVFGPDRSFATFALPTASLPDGRVYEAVSPVATEGNAGAYVPEAGFAYLSTEGEHGIFTSRPFLASAGGTSLTYPGDPAATGGGGSAGATNGDQQFSTFTAGPGWSQQDIQPTGSIEPYLDFSSDLSTGILRSQQILAPGAAGLQTPIYAHPNAGGPYRSLYSGPLSPQIEYVAANSGTATVPAAADLIFEADKALLPAGDPLARPLSEAVEGAEAEAARPGVLYANLSGSLALISVLPDGTPDAKASLGYGLGLPNLISADGSRVYWTDPTSGIVYLRENPGQPQSAISAGTCTEGTRACTVQVSAAAAQFWTATPDGRFAYYTEAERIFRFDAATGASEPLTPAAAEVQGVIGVNEEGEDGGYLYFVADGVLAANAVSNGAGTEEAQLGQPNLYLRHDGATTFLATLSPEDNESLVPFNGVGEGNQTGAWRLDSRKRTAELTPDGSGLLFMSQKGLTGYDNSRAGTPLSEVFLYSASAGLTCVSCSPSGEPPVPTNFDTYHGPVGGFFPITKATASRATAQPRVIADNGNRVFFDSGEPLVPQDTNGWLDVYEWERQGIGSCPLMGGCVYLISDGTNPDSSYLLAASASGDDAFFITRAQLVPQDRNGNEDVYDAKVGGTPPVTAEACPLGCAPAVAAAPALPAPASSALEGAGNSHAKPHKKNKKKKHHKKKHDKKKHAKKAANRAGHSRGGKK
jgi:DNA-binding beta-propeller fold protein YncE